MARSLGAATNHPALTASSRRPAPPPMMRMIQDDAGPVAPGRRAASVARRGSMGRGVIAGYHRPVLLVFLELVLDLARADLEQVGGARRAAVHRLQGAEDRF